jgi:hypothetical protein
MVVILPALRPVREDLVAILDGHTIERLCHELGYRWRDGVLDPFNTVHAFILQVLNRNTAMAHLPHLSGERLTASAYCQARRRLPLELFKRLADSFAKAAQGCRSDYSWRGRRTFAIDGSSFSVPDTPGITSVPFEPSSQATRSQATAKNGRLSPLSPLSSFPA